MGAFHEGHLDLMRVCKSECDACVVSLFVNPTQFGAGEDFNRYPRNEERDADLARSVGVDVLFAPSVEVVFPRQTTVVHVHQVTTHYEGKARPTHFDGVATVVLKLFNMVMPTRAYFGQKDLQQCAVVRRMVEDLNVPIHLRFVETRREADGLAMSSRNAYLSPEDRAVAPELHAALTRIRESLVTGSYDPALLMKENKRLSDRGFVVDYLDVIDTETMEASANRERTLAVAVAARIGKTRLIDNVLV